MNQDDESDTGFPLTKFIYKFTIHAFLIICFLLKEAKKKEKISEISEQLY